MIVRVLVGDAVLIELSPVYAAMSERRITGAAPLFVDVQTERANNGHAAETALPLFEGMEGT